MILVQPSSLKALKDLIISELKTESPSHAQDVLQLLPELAMDLEVQEYLKPWLLSPAWAFRANAAEILHDANNPEGILHLTYNSMHYYPILGIKNGKSSYYNIATNHARALTEVCIELMIEDMTLDRSFPGMPDQPYFNGYSFGMNKHPSIGIMGEFN